MVIEIVVVFLDSSALFAASVSEHGYARDLILAGLAGKLTLAASNVVLNETSHNLIRKALRGLPYFTLVRREIEAHVTIAPEHLIRDAARIVHEKDASIVAGAVASGARYLATYDRAHLLSQAEAIQSAFGITVATPGDILTALGLRGDDR